MNNRSNVELVRLRRRVAFILPPLLLLIAAAVGMITRSYGFALSVVAAGSIAISIFSLIAMPRSDNSARETESE